MLLAVEDIHVHYGRVPAVRGVSIGVSEGEIVCVVGPGVLRPSQGAITFDGESVIGLTPEAVARKGISQVPEGRHVFTTLSVEENLRLGTRMRRDRGEVEADFKRVLELFPVLAERRKVIGRALLTNPRIMTIDEPSLGLAPNLVDRVYEVLLELRETRGLTLLIVEQSSERALKAADRIYVLRSGEIQLQGDAAELQDGERVRQAYFGFTEGVDHAGEATF